MAPKRKATRALTSTARPPPPHPSPAAGYLVSQQPQFGNMPMGMGYQNYGPSPLTMGYGGYTHGPPPQNIMMGYRGYSPVASSSHSTPPLAMGYGGYAPVPVNGSAPYTYNSPGNALSAPGPSVPITTPFAAKDLQAPATFVPVPPLAPVVNNNMPFDRGMFEGAPFESTPAAVLPPVDAPSATANGHLFICACEVCRRQFVVIFVRRGVEVERAWKSREADGVVALDQTTGGITNNDIGRSVFKTPFGRRNLAFAQLDDIGGENAAVEALLAGEAHRGMASFKYEPNNPVGNWAALQEAMCIYRGLTRLAMDDSTTTTKTSPQAPLPSPEQHISGQDHIGQNIPGPDLRLGQGPFGNCMTVQDVVGNDVPVQDHLLGKDMPVPELSGEETPEQDLSGEETPGQDIAGQDVREQDKVEGLTYEGEVRGLTEKEIYLRDSLLAAIAKGDGEKALATSAYPPVQDSS